MGITNRICWMIVSQMWNKNWNVNMSLLALSLVSLIILCKCFFNNKHKNFIGKVKLYLPWQNKTYSCFLGVCLGLCFLRGYSWNWRFPKVFFFLYVLNLTDTMFVCLGNKMWGWGELYELGFQFDCETWLSVLSNHIFCCFFYIWGIVWTKKKPTKLKIQYAHT